LITMAITALALLLLAPLVPDGLPPAAAVLAMVLPLARLLAVWAVMPAPPFPWRDRLVVAGCGLRAAVPLALAVSMTEELPHLRGVAPALAEPLGSQLLALVFVAVLADLLLQPLLMRLLLRFSPEASPP
jgi:NhaP-type Na+/H+ or K+/H+ antiporter